MYAQDIKKITFVKNGQVYVAESGGIDTRLLTNGPSQKRIPKWSPDGTKIVYLGVSTGSKSLGELVVVDGLGVQLGRYPVATIADDGTPIERMRGVEEVGWLDDRRVYASGSVNPYIAEYRTIDIHSRQMHGFGGGEFGTCSRVGAVAFWRPVFPPNKAMSLETSFGKKAIFDFPDANALPTMHIPPKWDEYCKVVAFIDPRLPIHLRVMFPDGGGRAVLLPKRGDIPTLRTITQGLLIGDDGRLVYNLAQSQLMSTPAEILEVIKADAQLRKRTELLTGAAEADWWPSDLSNDKKN